MKLPEGRNCKYARCPFMAGFYLEYTGEKEFDEVYKLLHTLYNHGCRFYGRTRHLNKLVKTLRKT